MFSAVLCKFEIVTDHCFLCAAFFCFSCVVLLFSHFLVFQLLVFTWSQCLLLLEKNTFPFYWLLFVIFLNTGCEILVITAPVDMPIGRGCYCSTLAVLTYHSYACDHQLCSTLSNNYNDCVYWLWCMCLYSGVLLVVQWYYKCVVYQSARIWVNDSVK